MNLYDSRAFTLLRPKEAKRACTNRRKHPVAKKGKKKGTGHIDRRLEAGEKWKKKAQEAYGPLIWD